MQLKELLKGINIEKPKKKVGGVHSEVQALAVELSEYFNEKQKIGMYLGIVKRKGVEPIRTIFADVKDSCQRNFKLTPVKIFFYKVKQLN